MFQVKPVRVSAGESLQVDMFQVKPVRVNTQALSLVPRLVS